MSETLRDRVIAYLRQAGWRPPVTAGPHGELWRHPKSDYLLPVPAEFSEGSLDWRVVLIRLGWIEGVSPADIAARIEGPPSAPPARTPAQLWELLVNITRGNPRTFDELADEYPEFAARTRAQQAAGPPLALRQLADAVAAATYEDVAISAQEFAAKAAPAEECRDYRDPPAWPCWPSAPEAAPEPEAAAELCDRISGILLGPGGWGPPGPRRACAESGEPEPPAPAAVSADDTERGPVNVGEIADAAAQIATAIRQASWGYLGGEYPLPAKVCEDLADAVIDLLQDNPKLVAQITQGAPESAAVSLEDAERGPVDVGEIADAAVQIVTAIRQASWFQLGGPADAIVKVSLWLHDRFCGETSEVLIGRHDANYERALEQHLIQDGWINAAVDLLKLTREVDQ